MIVWYCWLLMAAVQFTLAQVFQHGMLNRPRNTFQTGQYPLNTFANNQYQNVPMATKPLINFANTNTIANSLANVAENNLINSISSAIMPSQITGGNLLGNVGPITNMPSGFQPNKVSYNFGESPIPVTISGKSFGNQPIGLQIMADNLQVNGKVAVSGRMPLYGTVTINGNVPSDGKSTVNYGCGAPLVV